MKNILLRKGLLLLLVISFSLQLIAQKVEIGNKDQIIENKIRINELDKKLEEQKQQISADKQELQTNVDKKIVELEQKLQIQKENLEFKNNWIGWWLAVLGILVTLFGIGIPIIGIIFGTKIIKDIDNQKQKVDNELNLFKNALTKKFRLLEEDAGKCIENLKENVVKGINYTNELEKLSKEANNIKLTPKEKEHFSTQAKDIGNQESISNYDKDTAKALELYLSEKYIEALEQYLYILRNYTDKITIDKLSEIYFKIGYLYLKLDNNEKSIEFNNKTLDLKCDNTLSLFNLSVAYINKEDFDLAIELCLKITNIEPDNSDAWSNIGYCFNCKKEYEQAIRYYKKALKINPNDYETWNNLGISYGNKEEYDEAIISYKKAFEINKNYEEAYTNLIELLLCNNQLLEVEKYFSELNNISSNDKFEKHLMLTIYSVITNKWNKDLNETVIELKKTVNNDPKSINWIFEDLNKWLDSDKSNYLKPEQKEFLKQLIKNIEDWSDNINPVSV